MTEDILQVVKMAKEGDSSAYEKLYEITNKSVWFTCISILKNEEIAKDIMQDTYVTAYQKLETLEDGSRVKQWLNKIAANKSLNYLKPKQEITNTENDMEEIENIPDEDLIPEEYVVNAAKRKIIMKIIQEVLTDEQYKTIIMYYFDEMTASEIAKAMNCHEKTVLYRIKVAKKKIKEGVMQYEKENKDRLHAVMPVPFLTLLFQEEVKSIKSPDISSELLNTLNSLSKNSNLGGEKMLKQVLNTAKGKIIAGICGIVIVGGAVGIPIIVNKNKPDNNLIEIETSDSEIPKIDKNAIKLQENASPASDWEYKPGVDDDEITITKYKGKDSNVVVPNIIEGKFVTGIKGEREQKVFPENEFIKSITLPDTILEGEYKFSYSGFENCKNLDTVTVPENAYSLPDFIDCKKLKNINIPKTIRKIGSFSFCESLESIELPEGVKEIGKGTFSNCKKLKSIKLPESIETIGESAFLLCKQLKSIDIPKNCTQIGEHAFESCENLSEIVIPEGVTSIERWTFYSCKKIEKIVLPKSVTSIGELAFRGCNIENIEIPDSVTSIGKGAFNYCSKLKKIKIPAGVTEIKEETFSDCNELKNIEVSDNVTIIGKRAFNGCEKLSDIKLPSKLEEIQEEAFHVCRKLEKVVIPNGTKTIGKEAFTYCTSLESIQVPDTVTSIGDKAFSTEDYWGFENLKEIKCSPNSYAYKYVSENYPEFLKK